MDAMRENFSLRYGLFLQPRSVEAKFWVSDVYKDWCQALDTWCLLFRLLNNSVAFVLHATIPGGSVKSWSRSATVAWALLAVAQYIWMRRDPNYYKRRTLVLVLNRVGRFVTLVGLVSAFNVPKETTSLKKHWHKLTSPFFSPPLVALRSLLLSSMALPCLMHGYAVPLPLVYQVIAHAIYLAFLVMHQLPTALAVVGGLDATGIFTDVCEWMTIGTMSVEAVITGTVANLAVRHEACQKQAAAALILFLMAFVGAVVPVYYAYRLERYAKELFLHHLVLHEPAVSAEAVVQEIPVLAMVDAVGEQSQEASTSICTKPAAQQQPQALPPPQQQQSEMAEVWAGNIPSEADEDELEDLYPPPVLELNMQDALVLIAAALLTWAVVMYWLDELIYAGQLFQEWLPLTWRHG